MSKTVKYLSIDSLGKEDVKALFDAICTEVIGKEPSRVKQEILKLPGTKKELDAYKPSLATLMTLIETYDIKHEFKITYVKKDLNEPVEEEEPFIDPLKKEMEEQGKSIKKEPDVEKTEYGGKKVQIVEVENTTGKPVKDDDIPDFE